jgi:four helix bundle protein
MAYHSFEDLEVWKRSCALSVVIFEVMCDVRQFSLKDQMERAAISIPSNIAEGSERGGIDFARFLRIASGSAAELRTQLYIERRLELISTSDFARILPELKEISKMLSGLRKSCRSRGKAEN